MQDDWNDFAQSESDEPKLVTKVLLIFIVCTMVMVFFWGCKSILGYNAVTRILNKKILLQAVWMMLVARFATLDMERLTVS